MGRVRFRILGRPEVDIDGAPLDIGAPKQQAVLAALMLDANEVVSSSRLADAVWPRPPAAAGANLRGYLAGLRRLLQVPGEPRPRLERPRGGHLLRTFGTELDLHAFDELAGQAESAQDGGRLREAADLFDRARRLWRGPVLDGVVHGPGLQAKAVRLEERRLAVTERWAQAMQDLGQFDRLATELYGLVTQHPLRERLWAHLMNALHRSGRPGEALAAYERVRGILADELGVQPSAQLQRLHMGVLRGEPLPLAGLDEGSDPVVRLDDRPADGDAGVQPRPGGIEPGSQAGSEAGSEARADRAATPPRQLPAAPGAFCGRDAELSELEQALSAAGGAASGTLVLAVDGTAGVGKSALALVAAHRVAESYPDGQLYVDLQGATPGLQPLEPLEVLGRFLRALGVRATAVPGGEAEAAALFRSVVAKRKVLVLLDDAACAAQVRPLLPGGCGCAALITSRDVLTDLMDARHLHLDILSGTDSISLLEKMTGTHRVATEAADAARLAALCGHLPLALRIVGARLAARPGWLISVLADRLAATRHRLDELAVADIAVRSSIGVTYHGLPEAVRRALRGLGMLRSREFAPWALAALVQVPPAEAERLLDRLFAVHLVELAPAGPGDTRYRFHDLVRLFAQERAAEEDTSQTRLAALRRVVHASLDLAERADRQMSAGPVSDERHGATGFSLPPETARQLTSDPRAWFDSERGFLIATVYDGLEAGLTGPAANLAAALTGFFEVRNHFDDWRQVQGSALAQAERIGDHRAAMKLHHGLGELDTIQDRYGEAVAHFEAALGLGAKEDPLYEGALTAGLGYLCRMQGRYESAVGYLTRARRLAERGDNRNGVIYALNNLGVVHLERGDLPQANACFTECLQLTRDTDYLAGQAQSLRCLGHVKRATGHDDAAAELYQRAAQISRRLGDRLAEAHAHCWLGKALVGLGRHREARRLLARCLWTYREYGNAWGEAATLWVLAEAQLAVARPRAARGRAARAVAIWRGIGSPYWLAQGLDTLARAHEGEGDLLEARRLRGEASEPRT